MKDHRYYEVLCTLAATGQLASDERAGFCKHCLDCVMCRGQLQDLTYVGEQLQLDAAMHTGPALMSAGSLERFRARAIREGIVYRPAPARSFSSYMMAAATLMLIAALAFYPHRRRSAEGFATATTEQIPSAQIVSTPIEASTANPRPSMVVRRHSMLHRVAPHTEVDVSGEVVTAQRFPKVIEASYPFFGSRNVAKTSTTSYSALSQSQISRLDFFRKLDDSSGRSVGSASARPIDIASAGSVFDFSANIRQLRFQLSSAQ